MRLAIMQPYLFPYLGYFQLLAAVDKFVVYDDVTYIKQGWVNRNRLLLNGAAHLFTVPLKDASSNRLIRELDVHDRLYAAWKPKFFKTLDTAYRKAPQYKAVAELVRNVLDAEETSIAGLCRRSIKTIGDYLELAPEIVDTAVGYNNDHLAGQDRVLDICQKENATTYINAIGGRELYSKDVFAGKGIALQFLQPRLRPYAQLAPAFVPGLSIIDVLMFTPREEVKNMLADYELI